MPEWVILILRPAGIFFLALFLIRLLGKRPISHLTLFDLVMVIVIGVSAAALSLNLTASLVNGLITLAVWTALPIFIYALSLKFKAVRDIYQGQETILVDRGQVMDDNLLKDRLTPEDLLGLLRKKNVFNFADVEFAVLEPTGDLNILLKKDKQPVTAKTLGLNVIDESVPQTIVLDGSIMDEALTMMGLNRNWLMTEINKAGVALENIFIAQADATGQLYLDLFNDAINVPKPTTREMALVTLKKCQADCEIFALATKDAGAKGRYQEVAETLKTIIQDMDPLLRS